MASPFLFLVLLSVLVQSSWGANRPVVLQNVYRQDGNSTATLPESPAFVCSQPGFFGDLTDCSRFYRCVDFFGTGERFTLFTFICGEGTIFDESLSVCNHPSWVSPPPACLGAGSSTAGVTPGSGSNIESSVVSTPCPPSTDSSSPSDLTNSSSSPSTGTGSEAPPTSIPDGSVSPAPLQPSETSAPSQPSETSPPSSSSGTESSTQEASPSSIDSSNQQVTDPSNQQVTDSSSQQVTDSSTASSAPAVTASVTPSPQVQPPSVPSVPFTLVCGDQRYHRHPLRCDLYYQCAWTDPTFSIDLKACSSGLVYDEASSSCLPPAKTVSCQIGSAPSTVAPEVSSAGSSGETESTTVSVTQTEAPVPTSSPQYSLAPGSLYNCSKPGHVPYQLDCIRFYRCFEVQPNVLKGLLYRCPPGYGYSTVTERCERQETLPPCNRPGTRLPTDYPIPFIPLEDTTMVRLEDFDSFFGNPNYFYQPRQYRIGSFQPILPPQFYYGY